MINKAVSKTKTSGGVRKWEWRIGPPKSRKSNRSVAAAEAVLELLRRLRSEAKDSSGLIFLGPAGKRMDPPTSMSSSSAESPQKPVSPVSVFMTSATSSRRC